MISRWSNERTGEEKTLRASACESRAARTAPVSLRDAALPRLAALDSTTVPRSLRKSRVGLNCRDHPLRISRGHPPARSRVRAIGDRKFGRHRKATPFEAEAQLLPDW